MSYKGDVVLKGNINQKAKINIEDIASGIYIIKLQEKILSTEIS